MLGPGYFGNIAYALAASIRAVEEYGERVKVEKWHGVPTEGKPDLVSIELTNATWHAPMTLYTHDINYLAQDCQPNLPWADDHFMERVGGEPLNPGEQFRNWPWYNEGNAWDKAFRETGKFTHTYMERLWSSQGSLMDVVNLLAREPYTRQAWIPIWFPEDTGVQHGGRVPCTLGYHLMLREEKLHMWYIIRSCDVIRYLRDDVYMAIRLADWVLTKLQDQEESYWGDVKLGDFTFVCFSLHMFEGDRYVR